MTLYTFFAVTIGKSIFPGQDPTAQVLLSLGIYGTGYCARPLGGILADRWGRKESLLLSRIAIILGAWPAFYVITAWPSLPVLLATVTVLSTLQGLGCGFFVAMVENFPKNVRVSGLSATYALGVVLSGGFGQLIVTWLIDATGSRLAPAFYVILIGIVSLIGVMNLHYRPLPGKGDANV